MSSQIANRIDEAYKHLLKAETEQQSVAPLTQSYPDLTIDEAYRVQLKMIDQKVRSGQRIVGKKIGLTSVAMQELLGVD
ncbi:2-keto-4-pentenoate hydratase [Peribacillus asahii]|uniref:2-keto-4-pentenoate hydratase n=3 Tax=Peribacillus asahii TaxID=228899 RepID=A0A3T0KY19_9BACI|nr:2-keto-4-pentenoate hydratase [Peribacillus asahii]